MLKKLQDLGQRLQSQFSTPDVLARVRDLAGASLDDPATGHVDAIPFPSDQDDPHDWSLESLDRERGINEGPILTPGQMALVLAAFHSNYVDVHCPGMEKVLVVSFSGWSEAPSQPERAAYRRYVRWNAIRSRIRRFGDWAEPWLSALQNHLERWLVRETMKTQENDASGNPASEGVEASPTTISKQEEAANAVDAAVVSPAEPPPAESVAAAINDPEIMAIAVMLEDSSLSFPEIAKKIGVDRKTLYKYPRFLQAAQLAGKYSPKANVSGYHTKGTKSQGNLEAQKDEPDHEG